MQIAHMPLKFGALTNTPHKIIVHSIAEYIEGNPDRHAHTLLGDMGLSAHAFITPSGTVIRAREDNQGAYHARNHNSESLGVEFLVPGVHTYATFLKAIREPYLTDEAFKAGVELVGDWASKYMIKPEMIKRHSDVDPRRKQDPGTGFPWDAFMHEVMA